MFDDVYPIVRETVAVNLAGAADRRKLLRAYRVYCHQVFAKVTAQDQELGAIYFYLFLSKHNLLSRRFINLTSIVHPSIIFVRLR